jgi:uncharacterized delta-60 repeat protein
MSTRATLLLILTIGLSGAAFAADGYYDTTWAGGGRLTFYGDSSTTGSDLQQIIVMPNGHLRLFGRVNDNGDSWIGEMQQDGTWALSFAEATGSGRFPLCLQDNCIQFRAGAIQAGTGNNVIVGVPYLVSTDPTGCCLVDSQLSVTSGINSTSGSVDALTLASLPDGKVIVAGYGYATTDTSRPLFGVARLKQDLSLDTAFNSATAGYTGGAVIEVLASDSIEIVHDVLIEPSGRVILVGLGNGSSGSALEAVRLNTDGTPDNTFGSGGKARLTWSQGTIDIVENAALDRAGRIVVALRGTTSAFGQEIMLAARLKTDGTLDSGFGPGAGFAQFSESNACASIYAQAVAIDSAGRILIAGDCANKTGDDFIVTRFRGDTGYLDASFGINGYSLGEFEDAGAGTALDIVFDASGRLIVGGKSFISAKAGIARLTYDLIYTNDFELAPRGCLPPDCN